MVPAAGYTGLHQPAGKPKTGRISAFQQPGKQALQNLGQVLGLFDGAVGAGFPGKTDKVSIMPGNFSRANNSDAMTPAIGIRPAGGIGLVENRTVISANEE